MSNLNEILLDGIKNALPQRVNSQSRRKALKELQKEEHENKEREHVSLKRSFQQVKISGIPSSLYSYCC